MSSLILTLQEELVAQLEADPFFTDVPVISRKKGELATEMINRIQNLVLGGGLWVTGMTMRRPDIDKPYFENVRIVFGAKENRTLNQTGKTAEEVVEKAAYLLHQFQPESITSPVWVTEPGILDVGPGVNDDGTANPAIVVWECHFACAAGLAHSVPKLATPTLTNVDGTITLSGPAGAAIYYTISGANPVPRVGTLYSAPFEPGEGLTVKARAWLAGYMPSDTASLYLPTT